MKPTDEQLRDPGWWAKHAPECATHYIIDKDPDLHIRESPGFYVDKGDKWQCVEPGDSSYWPKSCESSEPLEIIPRPTAWQGEGLPKAGEKCKIVQLINSYTVCENATITYQGDGVGCYRNNDNGMEYTVSHHDYGFIPLRTKEEVEREEVIVSALRAAGEEYDEDEHPRQYLMNCLHKIYDAGMLRKPMSREEANEALSKAFRDVPFSVSQRTALLDALGY